MRGHWVFVGILALAATAQRGAAEVFRCELADGGVVFTDRADACPRAEPRTLDKEVQTYETRPSTVGPVGSNAGAKPLPAARATNAQAGLWREKKAGARQKLAALQKEQDYLEEYITHCNRHGRILGEDASGLPYEVSCKNIRVEYAKVGVRLQEVRHYLDVEIEEECRRAGCLPGWIR